jgi:hypothetical protein
MSIRSAFPSLGLLLLSATALTGCGEVDAPAAATTAPRNVVGSSALPHSAKA